MAMDKDASQTLDPPPSPAALDAADLRVGDYIWVAITAALVAASGGRSSPFFLLFPLPVLHAAAFQSARRMTILTVVATLAFLTPLVYDRGETALFVAMAVIAVPPTIVVAWSLSTALATLRRQRRELATFAETVSKLQHITDVTLGPVSLEELLSESLGRIVDVIRS